jgi:dTDP-4-amino-4,6-dideoxygalactose transaminase
MAYHHTQYRVVGDLPHSQNILHNSFLIGAHHTMTKEILTYTKKIVEQFIKERTL